MNKQRKEYRENFKFYAVYSDAEDILNTTLCEYKLGVGEKDEADRQKKKEEEKLMNESILEYNQVNRMATSNFKSRHMLTDNVHECVTRRGFIEEYKIRSVITHFSQAQYMTKWLMIYSI